LCREFRVRAIAEELSEEALLEANCASSIAMQVATVMGIDYRFCDPNRTERARLKIEQENDIRAKAFLASPEWSESEIAARVADTHAKRERFWIKQLCELDLWPALFVCGANHVTSFSDQLASQNFVVHIAVQDWEPDYRPRR